MSNPDWEQRLTTLWAALDALEPDDFVKKMQALTAERPAGDAIALFEQACAFDSTGHPDQAVPLYQRALEIGLTGLRRRRAAIQLASSLRNLGQPEVSIKMLELERARVSDELDDAVVCVLALGLIDVGREKEAAGLAIFALSKHLVRYQRSMGNYAREVLESSN